MKPNSELNIGDHCYYLVFSIPPPTICTVCNGHPTHILDGVKYICMECKGLGKLYYYNKPIEWKWELKKGKVVQVVWTVGEADNGIARITYDVRTEEGSYLYQATWHDKIFAPNEYAIAEIECIRKNKEEIFKRLKRKLK